MIVLTNFYTAIVATPLLGFVLTLYIIAGMVSFRLHFANAATRIFGAAGLAVVDAPQPILARDSFLLPFLSSAELRFVLLRMIFSPLTFTLFLFLSLPGAIRTLPLSNGVGVCAPIGYHLVLICRVIGASRLAVSFGVGGGPSAIFGSRSFFVCFMVRVGFGVSPLSIRRMVGAIYCQPVFSVGDSISALAGFALRPKTKLAAFCPGEKFRRRGLEFSALGTLFELGRVWGMLVVHLKLILSGVKPGALVRRRPVFLLAFAPVIIPFTGVNPQ